MMLFIWDSLAPARSVVQTFAPRLRDKFLSPLPKRLKSCGQGRRLGRTNAVRPLKYFASGKIPREIPEMTRGRRGE